MGFCGQGEILGEKWYLKRESFGVEDYKVLGSEPTNATPITVTRTATGAETYYIGTWATPGFETSFTEDPGYNFEHGIWGYGSFTACKFRAEVYIWFPSPLTPLLILNSTSEYFVTSGYMEMIWSKKTSDTFTIPLGKFIMVKFYFEISAPGTYYMRYDGTSYKSYFYDPPETRYFRADQHTINGLTAYKLSTSQSSSSTYLQGYYFDQAVTGYWGIKVWKRTSAGIETQILLDGSTNAKAIVSRASNGAGLQSATCNITQTSLVSTDSIVVRVYMGSSSPPATYQRVFSTEQLGASSLDSATWTVYYYTYRNFDGVDTYLRFYYGSGYNSRIENFVWTPAVTKTWNTIQTWSWSLVTRQWNTIQSWDWNLLTRQWNTIQSWSFSLQTLAWHIIESWNWNLQTMTWHTIETWSFNLETMAWHIIESWNFNLSTIGWHIIETWVTNLSTRQWQNIQEWAFTFYDVYLQSYWAMFLLFLILGASFVTLFFGLKKNRS